MITGGAGFIGSRLCTALCQAGAMVAVVEPPSADLRPLAAVLHQMQHHPVDIRDAAAVQAAVIDSQPEYVFHLAAVGITDPFLPLELALAVNTYGSLNVFRACFQSMPTGSVRRLVHTGTPYEYGEGAQCEPTPINPYAASKAAAFAIARMFHRTQSWPIVTVRPFQVYGPGQPAGAVVPAALAAARSGQPFRMTGGEQRRDFIYVDDVVSGFILGALQGVAGRSYDLGWGHTYPVKEVILRLLAGLPAGMQPQFGALPYRPGESMELQADPESALRDLGWPPQVKLTQGLALPIAACEPDRTWASGTTFSR
jgi:nucleoside-diphosphate-sugar epimerase